MTTQLQEHEQALEVTLESYLKSQPWQLADIDPSIILPAHLKVNKGVILPCDQLTLIPGAHFGDGDDHYFASLKEPMGGAYRWFLYGKHVKAQETTHPKIKTSEVQKLGIQIDTEDSGPSYHIPGLGSRVTNKTKILINGIESNFTWGEATKGGKRIPIHSGVTDAILRITAKIQVLRKRLGTPIIVTSWYRPPAINAQVGGSSLSRHIVGDAIDFYTPQEDLQTVFALMRDDPSFNQGGLAMGKTFIHFDDRDSPARWYYPGAPRLPLW